MEAVDKLDEALQRVDPIVRELTAADPAELRSRLTAVESAKMDLMTAYTMNSLFWMFLSSRGIDPKTHPVRKELDRIKEYMARVQKAENPDARDEAQPSVNKAAAKRFVKAALSNAGDNTGQEEQTAKKAKHSKQAGTPKSASKKKKKKKSKKSD
ncbi:hypothetical protein PTSG_00547 [Salpingoeca rosetta]|uniref:Nuclear nucleic acid-binding protein C1D n=1 Tax=Salpingoeca rosetta (strain ATCC 50818 / BSB-021) TaxID=946362 RepID=F2TWS8_SALR5|nr:uncharacterized protein PTSG_00547 [Salpingoeca rosetta]EGD72524.1 hypothetical protein PTSG_00547 [Salpingoeca rosetta]|eukprot:XP_004999093.1 hypothetical protein PTSG_00547 [Salpingoeca rosetta]